MARDCSNTYGGRHETVRQRKLQITYTALYFAMHVCDEKNILACVHLQYHVQGNTALYQAKQHGDKELQKYLKSKLYMYMYMYMYMNMCIYGTPTVLVVEEYQNQHTSY